MRYLITTPENQPFVTEWFDSENHFSESVGMVVYDLHKWVYTTDGVTWQEIEQDHL
jgi:hypothetical protein